MAIKNIFKNKIVLYSIIIISVLIVGILVWGVLTKWQFWNAQKSSPKPKPFGPDHKIHNCGPYCEKCDDTGNCEECIKSENIHRIGKYCIKDNSHPCDNGETCALCNDDGKTCKNCKNGTLPDSKGRCCADSEKVNGECCKKCGDICCDLNKECTTNGYLKKCCDPNSALDFNGECCPKDKLTNDGICCTNDKGRKCGHDNETFCCMKQGGENTCDLNKECELSCGDNTCTDIQNCVDKSCVDKSCEWDNDTPAYFPSINDIGWSEMVGETSVNQKATCTAIENGQIEGTNCQLFPYGIVEENLTAEGAMKSRNTVMVKDINNNYITFLFPSSNISNSNYRFSKMKYETSKNSKDKSLQCNKKECEDALGDIPESSTIWFDNRNNTCVSEEATTEFKSPSDTNKCPFKNKKKCCTNKEGHWTGQVCISGNDLEQCIYDEKTKLGTCGYKCPDDCQSGMAVIYDNKMKSLRFSKCEKGVCTCLNPDGTQSKKGGSKWPDHKILNPGVNPKQVSIDTGIQNKYLNKCTLCVPDGTHLSTLDDDGFKPRLSLEKCGNGSMGCCSGKCYLDNNKILTCGCKCDSDCPSGQMCDGSSCIEKKTEKCWPPGTAYVPGWGGNCCHPGGIAECPDASLSCP